MNKFVKIFLATMVLFVLLAAGGFFWLKSEHRPQEAIAQAQKFIDLVQNNKFEEAYQLTLQNQLVGKTVVEFSANVKKQICSLNKLTTTFPLQSNGNRVRKWFRGQPIEPPEITVEFTGPCLFGVTLHSDEGGLWKVYFFQSHAG